MSNDYQFSFENNDGLGNETAITHVFDEALFNEVADLYMSTFGHDTPVYSKFPGGRELAKNQRLKIIFTTIQAVVADAQNSKGFFLDEKCSPCNDAGVNIRETSILTEDRMGLNFFSEQLPGLLKSEQNYIQILNDLPLEIKQRASFAANDNAVLDENIISETYARTYCILNSYTL